MITVFIIKKNYFIWNAKRLCRRAGSSAIAEFLVFTARRRYA